MHIKYTKVFAVLMAALLVLTACSSGGGAGGSTGNVAAPSSTAAPTASNSSAPDTEAVSKDSFPIVNEPITLEGVASKYVLHNDWNDLLMFQEYEKLTNIRVNWNMIPQESYLEKRNILIASNDLPDIFLRGQFDPIDEATYGNQGVLLAMNELIEQGYAPNLSAIMAKNSDVLKSISQADGNIYTLPQLNETMGNLVDKTWINTTLLDRVGASIPTTIDELYDVCVKFKEAGIVPISGAYNGTTGKFISSFFAGAFGFGRIGGTYVVGKQGIYMDVDANGQMTFVPFNENYKVMLQYINKLYADGLIDPELFTLENNKFMAKAEEGNVGIAIGGNNFQWIGSTHMKEYDSIPPLKGPNGDPYWIKLNPFVQVTGCFAITSQNQHPEASMRYADYLYSEEGTKLMRLGVEGVTYNKTPEGKYAYVDDIAQNKDGKTVDEMVGKYTIFVGGGYPQMITDAIDLSAAQWPEIKSATDKYTSSLPKEYLRLNFTVDEITELNSLKNDIQTYIEEMEIKFITGAESFDNWEKFTSSLEQMNAKRYVELYAAAYDRWNNF